MQAAGALMHLAFSIEQSAVVKDVLLQYEMLFSDVVSGECALKQGTRTAGMCIWDEIGPRIGAAAGSSQQVPYVMLHFRLNSPPW